MDAQDFAHQLREDYQASKLERARKPRPIVSNHAHSAGHPCERYLILLRVAWQLQAPMMDPIKAALFEEGHHQEHALVTDLRAIGFYLVMMQKTPIHIPDIEVVGEIDFVLRRGNDFAYVSDVKAVSPGILSSIKDVEDLLRHRRHWVRQWPVQLLLYLKGITRMEGITEWCHLDSALLILKDKTTGDIKPVVIPWMQEVYDATTEKLLRVNEKVREIQGAQKVPEVCEDYDWLRARLPDVLDPTDAGEVCRGCSYYHFCATDLSLPVDQVAILDDQHLEEFLEERERHRAAFEAYNDADGNTKALLRRLKISLGHDRKAYFLAGNFLITAREMRPKGKAPYFTYDIWKRPHPSSA